MVNLSPGLPTAKHVSALHIFRFKFWSFWYFLCLSLNNKLCIYPLKNIYIFQQNIYYCRKLLLLLLLLSRCGNFESTTVMKYPVEQTYSNLCLEDIKKYFMCISIRRDQWAGTVPISMSNKNFCPNFTPLFTCLRNKIDC